MAFLVTFFVVSAISFELVPNRCKSKRIKKGLKKVPNCG